jgi:Flp pilus assembly protein TadG
VRNDRAETLVEFALGSVILFMTMFGITEFGRGVWQYNLLANLAQETARWGAVRGLSNPAANACTTPTTANCRASWANAQTFVNSRSLGVAVTLNTSNPAPATLAKGAALTVIVTSSFTPLSGFIRGGTITLTSTAQMTMAR